ncbi:MAG: hypothetical protein JWP50_2837 [Phenylobacterium sp.]|nr:hypothetical protein [Phenylobacterium sp.]
MGSTAIIRAWRCAVLFAAASSLAACAGVAPQYAPQPMVSQKVGRPYEVNGRWYTPKVQPNYDEVGLASWYGPAHQGKPTADGERFDLNKVSAAHKTLPLPCIVEVTNLDNGKRLRVRVNDRGPFVDGRIIDLSQAAARDLGFEGKGLAHVRVRYVGASYAEAGETAIADARF